jgi:Tfp pilus assembly protein FimV
LLTLAGLGGLWLGAGALRSADGAPAPIRLAGTTPVAGGYRYVVQPGDSLWSIAVRVEPDGDPRPLVDELEAQLHGATPQPGNVLVLP